MEVVGHITVRIMTTEDSKKLSDEDARKILEVEQYLNHEVAIMLFQKFGVGLRVHL
jgi:hypothetical protein